MAQRAAGETGMPAVCDDVLTAARSGDRAVKSQFFASGFSTRVRLR